MKRKTDFCCTLCDDGEEQARFGQFKECQEHVRKVHSVTEEDGINSVIQIPEKKLLVFSKCGLCSAPLEGNFEEALKNSSDHFLKAHKAKKVRANQIKRVCRICGHDKCKTDQDLDKHLDEAHPADNFAEEENEEEDGGNEAEEKEKKSEALQTFNSALLDQLKSKNDPDLIAAQIAKSVANSKSRQKKEADSSELEEEEEDDRNDASSSNEEMARRSSKKSPKKKKKKKYKKHHKKSRRSRSESEVEEAPPDSDLNDSKISQQLEEDVNKVIHQRQNSAENHKSASGSFKAFRQVKVDNDIALFQGLRTSKFSRDDQESLSDGEIRDPTSSPGSRYNNYQLGTNNPSEKLAKQERTTTTKPQHQREEYNSSRSPSSSIKHSRRSESRSSGRRSRSPYRKRNFREERSSYSDSAGPHPHLRPGKLLEEYFCDACHVPISEENGFEHFQSKTHRIKTKSKIRCYLCSKHVDNLKMHLEMNHSKEVFRCNLSRCSNPKFMDLTKILHHVEDKHFHQIRNKSNDDLIKDNSISIPVNLCSYKCRVCNRQFVGQSSAKVLLHQRLEDGIRAPRERDIYFFCRICGSKRPFSDEDTLKSHCKIHFQSNMKRQRSYSSSSDSRGNSSAPKLKRKKDYCPCLFCPQVTENNDKDKRDHQERCHLEHLFRCRSCGSGYSSGDRSEVFRHLKSFHKICDLDEDDLLKHEVILPKNLSRIFCSACPKDKNVEWYCQEIIEVEKELQEHKSQHHPGVDLLAEIIRLGCRACCDYFEFDLASRKEWKNHLDTQHNHFNSDSRRRSVDRDGGTSDNDSTSARPNSPYAGQENCCYCLEPFPPGESKLQHVKRNHLNETFYCMMCSQTDPETFDYRSQLANHVDRHHRGDCRNNKEERDKYVKYPSDLRCFHCYLCATNFYGIGMAEIKEHFAKSHANSSGFDPGQIDYRCRICMESGKHDDEEELLEHLKEKHNCDPTQLFSNRNSVQFNQVGTITEDESNVSTSSALVSADSGTKILLSGLASRLNLSCSFCPSNFKLLESIQKHITEQHELDCFECKLCKSRLSVDLDTMKSHLELEHDIKPLNEDRTKLLDFCRFPYDPRRVKCIKCGSSFLNQANLLESSLNHLIDAHRVDSTRPEAKDLLMITCRWCSSRMKNFSDFQDHVKACFGRNPSC